MLEGSKIGEDHRPQRLVIFTVLHGLMARKTATEWRAEWKYDGERLQVHADKKKNKVQLFSRSFVLYS